MEKKEKGYVDNDPKEISEILKKNEKILWRGKPVCSAFLSETILGFIHIALLFAVFGGLLIYFCIKRGIFGENLSVLTFLLGAFLLVFFLPVYAWLFECLTAFTQYKHSEYVFTDRRVIAKKWRWGRYLEVVDYKKIVTINHVIKLTSKPFKAGDIVISCKNKKIVLKAIEDPAKTARELRKIVKEVKEDSKES